MKKVVSMKGVKRFESKEHFLQTVNKVRVNKRHQEVLDRVGAFASVESGQLPARHPDRLRDQMELMPGLVVQLVKADRKIAVDAASKGAIVSMVHDMRSCEGCDLAGGVHPVPRLGKSAKFMVVTDCPNWAEERAGKMLEGDPSAYLKTALRENGLAANDGYFTSLVKSPKNDKQVTTAQITACSTFIRREVEALKPPVIVALGGASIRHFVPDAKGGFADLCGEVVYDAKLDATIIFGINPMMIYMDPAKQEMLNEVFAKVAEIVS